MRIQALDRDIAVCSLAELPEMLRAAPQYWNVVSIRDPWEVKPEVPQALSVHYTAFEDVEGREDAGYETLATEAQVKAVFQFVDDLPGQPIVVHCRAGRSRSTAVALALIARGYYISGLRNAELCEKAAETILAIRPLAKPNLHVLRLGLRQFMTREEAVVIGEEILSVPKLLANLFVFLPGREEG